MDVAIGVSGSMDVAIGVSGSMDVAIGVSGSMGVAIGVSGSMDVAIGVSGCVVRGCDRFGAMVRRFCNAMRQRKISTISRYSATVVVRTRCLNGMNHS
jgi:hypothetical protein